jgi:hypothetical protein
MKNHFKPTLLALPVLLGVSSALAQGTAFTYQGRLFSGTNDANGLYDFRFLLYNDPTAGAIVAGPLTNSAVAVTNGLFTTTIDFGAGVFTGPPLWLHIGVRSNGLAVNFGPLSPRQPLTPTPYAITAENLDGGLPGSQLTGTLPSGVLCGVYGCAVTFNNLADVFAGDGSGLTGLNASALVSGTVNDARLSANVALLNKNQTFTGNNTFTSGTNSSKFIITNPGFYGSVDTNRFTGLALQYDGAYGESAIMASYNDGEAYLSFYTKASGFPVKKQVALDFFGNLALDQGNSNAGAINNGSFSGAGLTFGTGSGEGIASKRTSGGNQYGLDFYTSFANRMSIANSGYVGIGRQTPVTGSDFFSVRSTTSPGNYGGMYLDTTGTNTLPFYGYAMNGNAVGWTSINGNDNNKWFLYDAGSYVSFAPNTGNFGINTYSPSQALEVDGEFAMVRGLGNEQAYMGGDGAGNDVQFGSLNPNIMNVAFYNAASNAYMHIYCSSITINGGADLAEPFQISESDNEVPQGAVVVIDEDNPGHLKMSDRAYDTHVAGVVSGANGIHPGIQMLQKELLDGGKNVALTGRVYVQADASFGAIRPGDLLTTAATPGHAMKVADHAKAQGAILGKAMTGLKEGRGMVLVLVTLQ